MWAQRGLASLQPVEIGEKVLQAIKDGLFYILPHESDVGVRRRFDAVLSRRGPEPGMPIM
jgi:hypothetical protein